MSDANNLLWEETPVDITSEANFIWSIASRLRGVYMPDKYADVIIPMTVIRRFECTLESTKKKSLRNSTKTLLTHIRLCAVLRGINFTILPSFRLKSFVTTPTISFPTSNHIYLDSPITSRRY